VVGILNVTPDSFSDGGLHPTSEAAVAHGLSLFEQGADWVDVGGESTRPGAVRVAPEEERRRVVPVVEALRRRGAGPICVDTTRAEVARAALDAGADVVNDISALSYDPAMAPLVAERRVPAVLMHLRGPFEAMHRAPAYGDVVAEVVAELRAALDRAEASGVPRELLIVDPGLGFSKDKDHSLEILRRLEELGALERPIFVGPSRKSFIGRLLDLPVEKRLMGTAAAVTACVLRGAHLVRVHEVEKMLEVVRVAEALRADAARRGEAA
jgi:dihydropteroate synthase